MSRSLIKSGSAPATIQRLRPVDPVRGEASPSYDPVDPRIAILQAEIDQLPAQRAIKQQQAEAAAAASVKAIQDARTEGRDEGKQSAERQDVERLDALRSAIDDAVATFDEQLAGAERLAALMARECLDRILGSAEKQSDLLRQIIAHQRNQIEADSLISIDLSPCDFPDLSDLTELEPIGGAPLSLTQNSSLKSGEIVIRLKLGSLVVGLDQQWGSMRKTLTELAEAKVGG